MDDAHYGHIIEKVIRREGYSISEVARLTGVNRRSVYNWFNQKFLKTDIIFKLGVCIKHDFSAEFPHLFKSDDFKQAFAANEIKNSQTEQQKPNENLNDSYWKDKYIALLERYNDILIKNAERNPVKISLEGTINQ